jgi:hypothetical protein
MLMQHFESLGNCIAAEWAPFSFDSAVFPAVAANALRASRTCDAVCAEEILEWVASTSLLPLQRNLSMGFGEPPITLFWHPKFYIEALYWTVGTSSIHQHAFSGAFAVLEGSSIQSCYTFEVDRRVNAHMLLGALTVGNVRLLRKGDVEPIYPGGKFIHSVFHLDTPSVTIVIRTTGDVEHSPQYTYRRPYLAMDEFYKDPEAIRRTQILAFLDQINSPRFYEIAKLTIESSNLYVAYRLLEYLRFSPTGLGNFDDLVALARKRHGPDVDRLRVVVEELDREAVISSRRALLTSPDLRFFLALLMNVPSRQEILSLVKARFPGTPPNELVAGWAFDMSGHDLSGIEFNDLNRSLFLHLMDGLAIPDVLRRLAEEYTPEEVEDHRQKLVQRCTKMRQSTLFRPLLEEG